MERWGYNKYIIEEKMILQKVSEKALPLNLYY